MTAHLEPAGLGTVLGVWAHPDDEAYLSAGLMALARDRGSRVVVATATCGERGTDDPARWPPHRLAEVRRAELTESLAALGVTEHSWLGFADGGCADVPLRHGAATVRALIEAVRPDTVLTFGPDGMTGHPDHSAVSAWTTSAWRATGARSRLLYATATPEFYEQWDELHLRLGVYVGDARPAGVPRRQLAVHLELPPDALARKVSALQAQTSQTAALIEAMGVDVYTAWVATESFVSADPADRADVGSAAAGDGQPAPMAARAAEPNLVFPNHYRGSTT